MSQGCPYQKLLTNPKDLEARLTPYANYVDQVQAMLYFRNPIPMAVLLITVNLLFLFIGTLHLSFLPTLFLFLTLRVLVKIVIQLFGATIANHFFQPIQNPSEGQYPIYPLPTVCQTVTNFTSKIYSVASLARPSQQITIANAIVPLAALSGLFFFFLITGTFALNVIIVNLILILPFVLLNPKVKPYVEPTYEKLLKQKVE